MKNMVFIPADDITVRELADIVSGLMVIVPKDVIDKLDETLKRHWKEIPEKPRIVVPAGTITGANDGKKS